jgi:hypothetical protein
MYSGKYNKWTHGLHLTNRLGTANHSIPMMTSSKITRFFNKEEFRPGSKRRVDFRVPNTSYSLFPHWSTREYPHKLNDRRRTCISVMLDLSLNDLRWTSLELCPWHCFISEIPRKYKAVYLFIRRTVFYKTVDNERVVFKWFLWPGISYVTKEKGPEGGRNYGLSPGGQTVSTSPFERATRIRLELLNQSLKYTIYKPSIGFIWSSSADYRHLATVLESRRSSNVNNYVG